jgi:predicted lipoprotein with Yx(FWY)xxD motif
MKRASILLAGLLAGALGISAVAVAQSAPIANASRAAKVQLRSTSMGRILVDGSGFTLYSFTKDPRNRNTCVRISGCSAIWPALRTSGKPIAGPGVKPSLLTTITLPGGAKQVTYAGHALYLYAPSGEPGETSYIGAVHFGGSWDAVGASGNAVR